jgi:RIO kinase 1
MAKVPREKFKTMHNVFDEFTNRNLFKLQSEGFFEGLKSPVCLGKEANIFTAQQKDGTLVIVKIYRLENCNFNKMLDYIKQDPRYLNFSSKRREIVFSWTQREFKNLLKAREIIRVPTPFKVKYNIIVMELIGDNNHLSPMLKDANPTEPKVFFDKIVDNIAKLYSKGLVHGDLSQFNILNHNEEPVFIDFSQATITKNMQAEELLRRDVNNLVSYFNQYFDLNENVESIMEKIRKH